MFENPNQGLIYPSYPAMLFARFSLKYFSKNFNTHWVPFYFEQTIFITNEQRLQKKYPSPFSLYIYNIQALHKLTRAHVFAPIR